jgi:SNF2 family DNA or RNA helicase
MEREPIQGILRKNHFRNNTFKKASLIAKLEKHANEYYMVYYINNSIIENIAKGKREAKLFMFMEVACTQKKQDIIEKSIMHIQNILSTRTENIEHTAFQIDYENCLKPSVTMFKYQIQDILWMRNIENEVDACKTISYNYPLACKLFNDQFVWFNDNIFPASLLSNDIMTTVNFNFYGGNLISEVGLGKTITSLYHIFYDGLVHRHRYDKFVYFNDNCNYAYKRGSKKGTICDKKAIKTEKSGLYCKEHNKSVFIEKRCLSFRNLDQFNPIHFLSADKLIQTNASLVLCPNQLCDQWIREYYDKFKNDKRIVLIVTKDQHSNITLADILFADVVVVSYNFLLSNYYSKEQRKSCEVKDHFSVKPNDNHSEAVRTLLQSKAFGRIDLFKWNKIFLDEAHEIQNMAKSRDLKDIIQRLHSSYRWNISGTPFANGISSFMNLMSYNTSIQLADCTTDLSISNCISMRLDSDIIPASKSLFRRNTKLSISDEYEGNIIREYVKLLEFTHQERNIYNSYLEGSGSKYSDFLIKLCCHSELYGDTRELIQNCRSLDEIQRTLLDYNKKKIDHNKYKLNAYTRDIDYIQTQLERHDVLDQVQIEEFRTKLSNCKRAHTLCQANLLTVQRTYNYLYNAMNTLTCRDQIEHTCPICLDDIDKDNLAITKCGHKFCWDCLYETYQANKSSSREIKCPTCNCVMTNKEIFVVSDKSNMHVTEEVGQIVSKVKSTKVGNIIHFLRQCGTPDKKVILFSQYDELLHKVGDILSNYNLKLVYCNGTIYQRKNAIDSFKHDPNVNIIMLSSRNAASGINLTSAQTIILLEPVYGSTEYRNNIEYQAIGRADRIGQHNPIDVYRFIIKDTIEEDIVNNNIDDSKIKQMTI